MLQHLSDDPASLCSAGRAHSRLHQAAAQALTSIKLYVNDQEQLESLLLYLERHGEHVDSIYLDGRDDSILYNDYDGQIPEDDAPVTLYWLPSNLQLRSLECSCLCLQLQEYEDGRNGFGSWCRKGRLSSSCGLSPACWKVMVVLRMIWQQQ